MAIYLSVSVFFSTGKLNLVAMLKWIYQLIIRFVFVSSEGTKRQGKRKLQHWKRLCRAYDVLDVWNTTRL